MKPLDLIKAKFLSIFPVEENVREKRLIISKGRCEFSGEEGPLEMHHIITGLLRRKFFERVFTVRMVNENSHKGSSKGQMITHYRKELNEYLSNYFTDEEIRTITGRGLK